MTIQNRIALRIRELRESQHLTQEQLAWKSEVNRTFMNHVENGKRNISVETLDKILQGLEVSFPDFFNVELFQKKQKKSK